VWLTQRSASYSTVFWYKQWRETGVLDEIMDKLHGKVREQKPKWTTLIMIDSQAVKNTCNNCIRPQQTNIKRHLAVDTLGFPSSLTVPKPTSLTTRDWLRCSQLFQSQTREYSQDYNFGRSRLSSWNNQPSTARNLSPDPDQNSVWALPKTFKAEKLAQGKSGFVAVATRWVVERSNAWWNCKCSVKTLSGL